MRPNRRPACLLVTGFGAFPGMARNPSAELARRVAALPRWRRLGVTASSMTLPTTYPALAEVLAPTLAGDTPDAVLMIGVAGRSKEVRIERRALNRASILLPDAAGRRPTRLNLSGGPPMRRLGTSPMRLRAILRRHGIPCRISQDGGRYLCNAAYYQALDAPVPVLFIHIPKRAPAARPWRSSGPLRRLSWPEALAAALVDVGVLLTVNREHKRRAVAARGRPD